MTDSHPAPSSEPLYHVIKGWPVPHLEKDCPHCAQPSDKAAPKLCDDCGCEADCLEYGCAKVEKYAMALNEKAVSGDYVRGLEDAAQECDKAARIYRAMKTDEDGNAMSDAAEAEEQAYGQELTAKRIRALKAAHAAQINAPNHSAAGLAESQAPTTSELGDGGVAPTGSAPSGAPNNAAPQVQVGSVGAPLCAQAGSIPAMDGSIPSPAVAAPSASCVVVPREPTVKMRQAAYTAYRSCENTVSDWAVYVYRAMLYAAPAAQPNANLVNACRIHAAHRYTSADAAELLRRCADALSHERSSE